MDTLVNKIVQVAMTTFLQQLASVVKPSHTKSATNTENLDGQDLNQHHKDGESNISIDLCSTHSPKNNATKKMPITQEQKSHM